MIGDKAHHAPVLHSAQLLYLTALATAPFEISALTLRLPSTMTEVGSKVRAKPLAAIGAVGLALALAPGRPRSVT